MTERDLFVLKLVGRWRFLLSRHIKDFANFGTQRTADRCLKRLVEEKYLQREKLVYGVPYVYTLAHRGRKLIGFNKRPEHVRLDTLQHDITVLDCVKYFLDKYNITMNDIVTEKELHQQAGFGSRNHYPDFVVNFNKTIAVEVELSQKSKDRLAKNIELNYINYDKQVWILEKSNKKLCNTVTNILDMYSNTCILYLDEVLQNE